MDPRTRAVSPLDLVVAELLSSVESPRLLVDSAKALYAKCAVQISFPVAMTMAVVPTGRDGSTIYNAADIEKIVDKVRAWYVFQSGEGKRSREIAPNFFKRKAANELEIYRKQLSFGAEARGLTLAALSESDDAEQQAKALDLLYVYTVLGLVR